SGINATFSNEGWIRTYAGMSGIPLVSFLRQNRQRMKFDALLGQRLGVFGRGLAIDRAVLGLAVMHLARFLGEFRPDMVGILGEMVTQLLELAAQFLLLRRDHRDR